MPERGCFEQAGIRRDRPSCLVNALSYHKTIGVTQIKILAKSWTCGKDNTKLAFTKSDKSPKQLLLIGDNWYDSRKREKSKKTLSWVAVIRPVSVLLNTHLTGLLSQT
jgi:hypothetical protein